MEYEDNTDLSEKYPNIWAILLDKGYQGAHEMLRGITPCEKIP